MVGEAQTGRHALSVSSRPDRVAAVIASEALSGPGRQLAALATALGAQGIGFLVVLLHRRGQPPSPFEQYLAATGVAHRVVADRGPMDWRVVRDVHRVLRDWNPTIVQSHGYKATAVMYALRTVRVRHPWIGFFHGSTTSDMKDRVYDWIGQRLLGAADQIVVMSQRQARALRRHGSRVRIIHNAVLAEPPQNGGDGRRVAEELGALPRPLIGVVSRLSSEKGVDVFLDACALLLQKGFAGSAVIAGDGPERARLEERCGRQGLGSTVRFLGHVDDVTAVYQRLDLFVLPSRSEGLPNALLEALRADVPVVATTVGAVPEVVGSSAAARLVPPGSPSALADAIQEVISEGDTPAAAAARREVVQRFTLERRVAAHLELYRELMPPAAERASAVRS